MRDTRSGDQRGKLIKRNETEIYFPVRYVVRGRERVSPERCFSG